MKAELEEESKSAPPTNDFLALAEVSAVLETHVLPRLNLTDLAMLSRASKACREAVVNSGLPRAGMEEPADVAGAGWRRRWRFKVDDFVGSVARLSWARDNGCPWDEATVERIVAGGCSLEVLKWAVEHECPGAWAEWWRRAFPDNSISYPHRYGRTQSRSFRHALQILPNVHRRLMDAYLAR